MRTSLACLACLVLSLAPIQAGERQRIISLSIDRAAQAVIRAAARGDDAKLVELARRSRPDPWRVADELCHRGEHELAERFARAAPSKAIEQLPAYIQSRKDITGDHGDRAALATIHRALDAGAWQEVIDAALPKTSPLDSVVRILATHHKGIALRRLGRAEQSTRALARAARAAEGLGWLRQAAAAHSDAGMSSFRMSDIRGAVRAWKDQLRLEETLKNRAGAASALNNLAIARTNLRDFDAAIHLFSESLNLKRDLGDQPGLASGLYNRADLHHTLGDFAAANRDYSESIRLHRLLKNKSGLAGALNAIGLLNAEHGHREQAEAFFAESLALRRELDDRLGIARTLVNMGNLQRDRRNLAEARRLLDAALQIAQSLDHHNLLAAILSNIGNVKKDLGDLEGALGSYRNALDASRAARDRTTFGTTLGNIGTVYQLLGEYDEARRAYAAALAQSQEAGVKSRIAEDLNRLGTLNSSVGNYSDALRHHEQALSLARSIDHQVLVATTRHHIGALLSLGGGHRAAVPALEAALRTHRALGHRSSVASVLNDLGNVESLLGNHAGALDRYAESLKLTHPSNKTARSVRLANIGNACAAIEDYGRAIASYRQSFRLASELGDKVGMAISLANEGQAHERRGDHDQALERTQQAHRVLEELSAPPPKTRAVVLGNLASLYLSSDRLKDAVQLARSAVESISGFHKGLGEMEGATVREGYSWLFDVGYRAAMRSSDPAGLHWFLERGRASSLREGLATHKALRGAWIPSTARETLAKARRNERETRIEHFRVKERAPDGPESSAAESVWHAARRKLATLETRLEREARRAANAYTPEPDDLSTIQSHLALGETLIYYALTSEEAGALVVTRDGARQVKLGPTREIVAAGTRLLRLARGPGERGLHIPQDDAQKDLSGAAARLRKKLVAPLGLDDTTRRVLICPMIELAYVPFAMLFDDVDVAYAPSGTIHRILLKERPKKGSKVLGVGDPDYANGVAIHARTLYVDGAGHQLPLLPGTRREVDAVADVVLVSRSASEKGVKAAIEREARWRSVHFACHGLVDPSRPMFSSLALTPDKRDDGFLTAAEVLSWSVPSDLVVLSACQTGTGRVFRTEGIVGLFRAFMYAGTPRVICSLWNVDDDATQALMTKFYERWNPKHGSGIGAASALRVAQKFVRSHAKWRHPHFWAAWVLWGVPD